MQPPCHAAIQIDACLSTPLWAKPRRLSSKSPAHREAIRPPNGFIRRFNNAVGFASSLFALTESLDHGYNPMCRKVVLKSIRLRREEFAMIHRPCPLPRNWLWMALALCGLPLTGCQTLPPSLVACPMPAVEQASRVQKIVPIGTPRDEAVAKLKKAGIDGTFSTGNSIFYCDTWTQGEEERWHINVELLFNESGEVYAYRPDPERHASSLATEIGTAKVRQSSKEIAAGPKPSVVDPFAELE